MKRILFVLIAVIGVYTGTAQDVGVGVSAGYLSELEALGGSADVNYNINEKLAIGVTGTFASATPQRAVRIKWFIMDLNAHYKVYDELYVLGGGSYLSQSVKFLGLGGGDPFNGDVPTQEANEFGFNVGAGYKYNLSDNVNIYAEVKYTGIDTGSYIYPRLGLMFDL